MYRSGENLNITVQIVGSSIEVANENIRKELARLTNMFIQTFVFQEITNPDKAQVKMIKDNYSRMAHKWIKDTNRTLLVARRNVMNELFPRPSSTIPQLNKPSPTPTFRQKQSPVPRKHDQQPTPSPLMQPLLPSSPRRTPTTTTTTMMTDNLHVVSYTIENEVYIPFFSPSSPFPTRLSKYLSSAFNVKLEIKTTASTRIALELRGQNQDAAEARSALASLFTSFKSKTYSPTADCKFLRSIHPSLDLTLPFSLSILYTGFSSCCSMASQSMSPDCLV